jgi:biopolymer transport protein ExbB
MIDPTEISHHFATVSTSAALKTSWEFLEKGGVFMIPLGITSVIGMMAIIYKFLSLSRNRVIPDNLALMVTDFEELVAADQTAPILKQFEKGESTLARLCHVAFRHRGKPQSDIVQSVEASAREETSRLHAGIGILDIVITVAPLLGLLGTASGLVTIFQGLSDAADHLAIARGIAEALNTTIFGLSIAVPCVISHGYFTRRIEVLTARLESLLADLAHVCQKLPTKG